MKAAVWTDYGKIEVKEVPVPKIGKNDVLLKVLLNENEAQLPLPTDLAPYYHYLDFREFYVRKLQNYEIERAAQGID